MYKLLPFLLFLLVAACKKNADSAHTGSAIVVDSTAALRVREVMGIAVIEPAGRITALASESKGIVRDIRVHIGQSLKAGQTILVLDSDVENAQVNQASSKLGAQREAIQAAEENLRLLEVQLRKAKSDLGRNEALFNGKALTQQELDNSRYQVANLEQQMQAQQAVLRQQKARINELETDIRYFQTVVGQKTVTAPSDGALLSLDAKVGAFLDANAAIGDFAPAGPVIALTEIDELFADQVRPGQKAIIRPQGKSDTLATGTVILTSPYLRKKSLFSDKPGDLEDRRVREVRVQLDDPSQVLLGARVECVIKV